MGDFALSYDNKEFCRHPDTNFEFRNFTLSVWNEIQKFVTESAAKLPFFAHLGWDIASTTNGPVAIEANLNPGIEATQIALGGLPGSIGKNSIPTFIGKIRERDSNFLDWGRQNFCKEVCIILLNRGILFSIQSNCEWSSSKISIQAEENSWFS